MFRITSLLCILYLALATSVAAQGDPVAMTNAALTTHLAHGGAQSTAAAAASRADVERGRTATTETSEAGTTALLPHYAAGDDALAEALRARLRYPAVAQENGIEGTCVLRVRIDERGQATGVGVVESLSADCDAAAIAAVEGLGPFTPARLNGRAFARTVRLAVEFKL